MTSQARKFGSRNRMRLRRRIRQGQLRVRSTLIPVISVALGGVLAYLIAEKLLGHQYPFFAPIGVWACLGVTGDRRIRRVAELAVGVAVGVGFGTFAVYLIGSGAWQIALVMVISVLAARFVDRGILLATQAGTQSIVIVGLPMLDGGPIGRWSDAMVGGAVALLLAAIMPGDLRGRPRDLGVEALTEMDHMLTSLSSGLTNKSVDDVEDALTRGRNSERVLEEWATVALSGLEASRVSAPARKHRGELTDLHNQAILVDRAMRTFRVVARRAIPMAEGDHDFTPLGNLFEAVIPGLQELATAIGGGTSAEAARAHMREAARLADPGELGLGDWQVQSLMMVVRSAVVDLLEVSGVGEEEARNALPVL